MSVKEAVRIAQSNNFMGLVCSSRLLVSLQSRLASCLGYALTAFRRTWYPP